MAFPRSFVRDPVPLWDVLGADDSPSPLLPVLVAGGCNLLIRNTGLPPNTAQNRRSVEDLILAAGTAAGRQHIQLVDTPPVCDPTHLDILFRFRSDPESTGRMQELADSGSLLVTLPDGRTYTCVTSLCGAWKREGVVIVRGFPVGWGREGVTRMLLSCAGYDDTEVEVIGESAGSLPACVAAEHPGVASGDTLVALVRVPEGDYDLRKLPRARKSPAMHLRISIEVQGHEAGRGPSAAAVAVAVPNPVREHQRAQRTAHRAKMRQEAQAFRELAALEAYVKKQ